MRTTRRRSAGLYPTQLGGENKILSTHTNLANNSIFSVELEVKSTCISFVGPQLDGTSHNKRGFKRDQDVLFLMSAPHSGKCSNELKELAVRFVIFFSFLR
eukprot:gb/GEZN01025645.1/.p1 GENE.gb/GEZN01025645.1/~~gb/GEZN01025645.1/.p1  ORF type:complete len:101 (-),score=1.37 gb/GEZN01025645.1/:72-374(-)